MIDFHLAFDAAISDMNTFLLLLLSTKLYFLYVNVTLQFTYNVLQFVDLPQYCLLGQESGYGDEPVARYYYNATMRRCQRFIYHGEGGNQNRFENLHQCHTECGGKAKNNHRFVSGNPTLLENGSNPKVLLPFRIFFFKWLKDLLWY